MSKPGHHVRKELCLTRAPYREGRKPTAVKVYTVNQESKYLVVQGVPSLGVKSDLMKLFSTYGEVDQFRILSDYPSESFTNVYLVSYKRIQSARVAKRRLDDWSFFGGVLHICYAPEYETSQETREKLQERRKTIAAKIKQYNRDGTYSTGQPQISTTVIDASTRSHITTETGQKDTRTSTTDPRAHMKLVENHGQGQKTCYDSITLTSSAVTLSSPLLSCHQQMGTAASFANDHARAMTNETVQPNFDQLSHLGVRHPNGQLSHSSTQNALPVLGDPQGQSSRSHISTQLHIPPPPRESRTSSVNNQNRQNQNYNFARVRSSQAVFPPNFDARLHKPEIKPADPDRTIITPPEEDLEESEIGDSNAPEQSVCFAPDKTMQERINENLTKEKVVIKEFSKKGTVPKFIPRQMLSKKKLNQSGQIKANETDEVSKELRRNAFILKDLQGPKDIQEAKREGPELQISSVEKSVKEIRKHVTQFSDRNLTEIPAKRKKMADS